VITERIGCVDEGANAMTPRTTANRFLDRDSRDRRAATDQLGEASKSISAKRARWLPCQRHRRARRRAEHDASPLAVASRASTSRTRVEGDIRLRHAVVEAHARGRGHDAASKPRGIALAPGTRTLVVAARPAAAP